MYAILHLGPVMRKMTSTKQDTNIPVYYILPNSLSFLSLVKPFSSTYKINFIGKMLLNEIQLIKLKYFNLTI